MKDNKISDLQVKLSPRSKIWIESQGEVVFGRGRLLLFEAISETGSIRQAATKLNMSYRAAWGKIKATEERLGMKLLEKNTGGHKSGAELTPEAVELLESYGKFKEESEEAVNKLFAKYFDGFINKFR
ncbi:winged helix-turn-helix domain-containing protein [Clostridium formicaceticum]|uniref:DNA-binding transcriptional regulator ModE n=1 Tax=Clostridium formicaceticum TaxID=1497 RepID=A0AAC9WI30_9CLOT|nr:LysR family transcriptional regulator [Clostridium formicaceticum]AOY77788.1 LysR family transcriptional regulator [Clostridium formicaceticum]ARE88395.1 DNA-binding transcriptional regulator ModE [Clostridium formicaceticum]